MKLTKLIAGMVFAMFLVVATVRGQAPKEDGPPTAAQLRISSNNMKMIALAFHLYHDKHSVFPGTITDNAGKPLLSWRVAILPFIEQELLFKQFKLNEPWDSNNNKPLLAKMPKVFAPVRMASKNGNETYYRGFNGAGAFFETGRKLRFADCSDGLSNTLMIVEAGESTPWTKPDDLPFDAAKKLPALGGMFDGQFHAALADGSVRRWGKGTAEATLIKLITRNGGEVLDFKELNP